MNYLYIGDSVFMKPFDNVSKQNDILTCLYIVDEFKSITQQIENIKKIMYLSGFDIVKNGKKQGIYFYNPIKNTYANYFFVGKNLLQGFNTSIKYKHIIIGDYYPPTDVVCSLIQNECVLYGAAPYRYEKLYEHSIVHELYDNYKLRCLFNKYVFIDKENYRFVLPTWGSFTSFAQKLR